MQPNPVHGSKLNFFAWLLGFALVYIFLYWCLDILAVCLLSPTIGQYPDFLYHACYYGILILPYVPAALACLPRHRRNLAFVGAALTGCVVGTIINYIILNDFLDLSVG